MADEIDRASEREELDRQVALRNALNRPRTAPPLCSECGEVEVFTTSKNVQWCVCWDCAQERLAAREGRKDLPEAA